MRRAIHRALKDLWNGVSPVSCTIPRNQLIRLSGGDGHMGDNPGDASRGNAEALDNEMPVLEISVDDDDDAADDRPMPLLEVGVPSDESETLFERSKTEATRRLDVRTNNDLEGYHNRLNGKAGSGVGFYRLVPHLRQESEMKSLVSLWDKYEARECTTSEFLAKVGQAYGVVLD
ncbi:hypothetical protein DPMN_054345 [Dreissena polymorpha]|uniref:Uncharacterized protein n=1 Tax=Dreissena polymorpha TaxID=45954 RepID=A0A9D4CN02_DREPO|nr:hypothetical protein DPMN_054345 [Dreissena polymorpha]